MALPQKKAFTGSLSGWGFGISVIAMKISYDSCKCVATMSFTMFFNFEYGP